MSVSYDGGDCQNWRKALRSMNNGNCAEIGATPGMVLVRDSKDRWGEVLQYSNASWLEFVREAKAGHFDVLRLWPIV